LRCIIFAARLPGRMTSSLLRFHAQIIEYLPDDDAILRDEFSRLMVVSAFLSPVSLDLARKSGLPDLHYTAKPGQAWVSTEIPMVRWFAACAFIFILSMAPPNKAFGQNSYPTRSVKFLVPYPGGGTNDVLARIVGDKLQAKWGQPVIIENRSGGSGNIGAALVAQAEPDGYTLLVSATPPLATNQSLYKELSYKPEEFVPITNFGSVPNLVIVRKGLPVNSLSELIAYAKANPGKLVYGSQGAGNTPHLTANMFMNMTGTSMVHVPYRGETLVYNDMLGERVDVFFGNISGAFALYLDGKLKVLAVLDKARNAAMPDVPTSAEVALPGLLSGVWYAMVGPPKLKPELRDQIAEATIEVLKMPDVQQRFRKLNVEPDGGTPAETAAFIKNEVRRWGEVIRANHIMAE
jgi:tripartite-type tricarboxylate transporter receptor subunit TctC